MKLPPFSQSLIAAALLSGLSVLPATAQNDQTAPAKMATVTDNAPMSPGVADILKMVDAGVSKDVIKVYIENSAVVYNPGPADLIALKGHGVTDDLTMVLLKRGSENQARAAQAAATSKTADPAAVQTVRVVNSGRLDPEGYDYFQRFYLQPRALGYSYQLLGYPYAYGPYQPLAYGYSPRFPGGYGYRPRF